jgi:DNA-binding NarL/FixJ family response regulator
MNLESEGSGTRQIRVVIADDHPVVLAGLKMLVAHDETIKIVGEAGDGFAALEVIGRLAPDVVVLDIEMPGMSGLDVMVEMRNRGFTALPIVLTLYDDHDVFDRAIAVGARGYILKDSAPRDIVRGIHRVSEGDYFLSPKAAGNGADKQHIHAIETLTGMERRILKLIGEDKSTREIASVLAISPRTVDHHRANMCSKLGVSGCFALVRIALGHRLLL